MPVQTIGVQGDDERGYQLGQVAQHLPVGGAYGTAVGRYAVVDVDLGDLHTAGCGELVAVLSLAVYAFESAVFRPWTFCSR